MSKLLLNRKISVNRRLRVFDSTVGSYVLWCTESWTPRVDEFRKLTTARKSMLRKIVGVPRGRDEEWLDWLKRCIHKAVSVSDRVGVRCWIATHLQRKWQWAGHVARRSSDTWLLRTTTWRDSAWQATVGDLAGRPMRPSRRRWMKWEEVLCRYCSTEGCLQWMTAALVKDVWNSNFKFFVECSSHT